MCCPHPDDAMLIGDLRHRMDAHPIVGVGAHVALLVMLPLVAYEMVSLCIPPYGEVCIPTG